VFQPTIKRQQTLTKSTMIHHQTFLLFAVIFLVTAPTTHGFMAARSSTQCKGTSSSSTKLAFVFQQQQNLVGAPLLMAATDEEDPRKKPKKKMEEKLPELLEEEDDESSKKKKKRVFKKQPIATNVFQRASIMLVYMEDYDSKHVITRLMEVMGLDKREASAVLENAKANGKAEIAKYTMEISEALKRELLGSNPSIKVSLERI